MPKQLRQPVNLRVGRFEVEWRCFGEQSEGHQQPLLRFTCYWVGPPSGLPQAMEQTSYLTLLPETTPVERLVDLSWGILEALEETWPHDRIPTPADGYPYKTRLMLLSQREAASRPTRRDLS